MARTLSAEYTHDLALVPPNLRKPLEDALWRGKLPLKHTDLLGLLSGNVDEALQAQDTAQFHRNGPDFVGVVVFVAKHFPDIAYGHPAYMLRWAKHGGLDGRASRLKLQ